MDLNPKELEAAGRQLRSVCGKIDQTFAQRDPPSPQEWTAIYEREVKSIFDAADLIPRSEYTAGQTALSETLHMLSNMRAERDEALKQLTGFKRAMEILVETHSAQIAALRKALEKIAQLQRDKCENASAEMLFMLLDNKVDIARTALDKDQKKPVD